MVIKQLSVFVENQPGRLSEITDVLSGREINIRALSIADTTNFTVSQTSVIGVGIEDRPGGLAEALNILREAGMDVEYMYAFVSHAEKTAYVILRVADNDAAEKVLRDHGIPILSGEDVY